MARINFPDMEQALVEQWKRDRIFERSIEERPADHSYVFYDGPPFATGLPHYGHIVASTLKDVVPRYATMRGYRVERRWGWDCHGLPIENLIESELGLKTKQDIEKIGVDTFNEACRANVLKYAKEWRVVIERLGRWVDMSAKGGSAFGRESYGQGAYRTMDIQYTESIWWAFKQLYDKGLIYEGKKSMHLCPRCETTLSNFEVTLGYKDVTDVSAVVQFELVNEPGTYVLAWTTTPWTLPGNVAVAVGPDVEYVQVSADDKRYILAKERVAEVFGDRPHMVESDVAVSELVGQEYKPLFPYFVDKNNSVTGENSAMTGEGHQNMFKIYVGNFVNLEEGTGMVHIASGYGEDDYQLSVRENIPLVQHVGWDGLFKDVVTEFAGQPVKPLKNRMAADQKIVKYLADHDTLFSEATYLHSYPHCWRCDTPLLNYASSSWFVKVTDVKERMLAHNATINWVPEHVKDGRFGKWLDGAKDWAISRDRYWGAPLPVWQSDDGDTIVVGSVAELKELSGQAPDDLHKQFVDPITIERDGKTYHRVPQVLDCWFESGSMPYAQEHYPFENKDKFETGFPAQFIAEGLDQTRGWFYTLMVLGTALFDKPAFQNVIVNGLVLAEDGKKMSKRLQNYPEPSLVMDKYGADALRFYLMSSPVVSAQDLRFSEKGVDQMLKRVLLTLWNVYSFYDMFTAETESINGDPSRAHIMDRWVVAYVNRTVIRVTQAMDAYQLQTATQELERLIQEVSTWYVRRSRDRFKGNAEERFAAMSTLRYVLLTMVKMMAPFTPFIAERIYLDMQGPKDSVHLDVWPEATVTEADRKVLEDMAVVRGLVEQALALREQAGLKVRQPLAAVVIPESIHLPAELIEVLREEVNVKQVRVGKTMALDTELTPELKQEGLAREFVRSINAARKKHGFTRGDQKVIRYQTVSADVQALIEQKAEELQNSTMTTEFIAAGVLESGLILDLNGEQVTIEFIES